MVDERLNGEQNFRLVKENLIDGLLDKGLKENVHPFIIGKSYEDELKKYGGRYDVVLLSSGEGGHIAALFPNHSVNDDSDYFFIMDDSPKMPMQRISASRKLLEKLKVAVLLFLGKSKEGAYRKFLDKNISVEECPAKIVNYIKDSYVITNFRG